MVRASRMVTVRQEPQVGVVIGGILHNVPASQVEIEKAIEAGVKLETEIAELEKRREARGADLVKLIEAHQAQIKVWEDELRLDRGPLDSQIATKTTELQKIKDRLFDLLLPRMADQKSMKFAGLAGAIEAVRTPKMDVPRQNIPALRKLLGPLFSANFEVTETAKPLSSAWSLLKTLRGGKLGKFRDLLTLVESAGRVRFLPK